LLSGFQVFYFLVLISESDLFNIYIINFPVSSCVRFCFFLFFFFVVLKIKLRASCMLGKHSSTELHPQLLLCKGSDFFFFCDTGA
jgi:hypothetical protein